MYEGVLVRIAKSQNQPTLSVHLKIGVNRIKLTDGFT